MASWDTLNIYIFSQSAEDKLSETVDNFYLVIFIWRTTEQWT